jgi:hypothetical protein
VKREEERRKFCAPQVRIYIYIYIYIYIASQRMSYTMHGSSYILRSVRVNIYIYIYIYI